MESKPIGQTKAVGFQVGVRRTFPISQEKAWELVTSAEGFELWLGLNTSLILKPGQAYIAKTGAGELRVVKPLEQLRLTWKKMNGINLLPYRFVLSQKNIIKLR